MLSTEILRPVFYSKKLIISLLTGLSLFYVLYIFEGYGIQAGLSSSGHSLLFRAVAFGILTTLVFGVCEFFLADRFSPFTIGKKMLWRAMEFFLGASATFLLFNYFWSGSEWTLYAYTLILLEYSCVMLVPVLFVEALFYGRRKKDRVSTEGLTFFSENRKEQLRIRPADLLFLQSAGNYVEIFYFSEGKMNKQLLRNSLKNMEKHHEGSSFLQRCHRSYLVNPAAVRHIKNVKGKTELDLGPVQIPVSKQYQDVFLQ